MTPSTCSIALRHVQLPPATRISQRACACHARGRSRRAAATTSSRPDIAPATANVAIVDRDRARQIDGLHFLSLTSLNSASTTFSSSLACAASRSRLRRRPPAAPRRGLRRLRLGVHLLAELLRRRRQRLGLGLDRVLVASCPSAAPRRPSAPPRSSSFSSASTLSPYSASDFFTLCTSASSWLRACTSLELLACRPRRAPRRPSPSSGSRLRTGPSSP